LGGGRENSCGGRGRESLGGKEGIMAGTPLLVVAMEEGTADIREISGSRVKDVSIRKKP